MAESNTEICNLALAHLGLGTQVEDLSDETESSDEAQAARVYYETALKSTLRDFNWPFAKKALALTELEEEPTEEWEYSYTYPDDCVMLRRIYSGTRNETRQTRMPYHIANEDGEKVIYCDAADATMEYTAFFENVLQYPDDFVMAFSFRLAFYMANRLQAGDAKIKKSMWESYQVELSNARCNAANEEQPDEEPPSEFVRARD